MNNEPVAELIFRSLREQVKLEDRLVTELVDFERLSFDPYDSSLEAHGVPDGSRLSPSMRAELWSMGFVRCWLNHVDGAETYYVGDAEHRKEKGVRS